MLDDKAKQTPNRQADRADVTVEVGLEFDSFQGFLSEYSSNISTGGMFVKATNPPPVGTVLRFTLKLKGDFQLIKGTGEVTWVRMQGQGPRLPPGMGIRFMAIPDSGVDLIQKMVERYREQGGRPFDVKAEAQPAMEPVSATATASAFDGAQAAPALLGEGSEVFTPDIFIPPDIPPKIPPERPPPASQPLVSPSVASPSVASQSVASQSVASQSVDSPSVASPGPSPPRPDLRSQGGVGVAQRSSRIPRQVRLSLVVLLILVAGAAGALSFAFGERVVNWASGYDNSLEQPQVFDVPPPVSLVSQQVETSQELSEPAISAGETPSLEEVSAAVDVGPSALALNRVRLITWKAAAGGGTLVTFWGDGFLTERNLVHVRFGDRPVRELLKLQGVNWPFRDPVLEVDSPEVRRIRTGFHPKSTLNELHIVIDLADPEVRLVSLDRGPRNIELLFQR